MTITLADDFGRLWVTSMFETLLSRKETLADLDRRSGDGDFGTNIASALRRAQEDINENPPQDYLGWVTAVSRGFLGTGGTSGPLFGMFFRELSQCSSGSQPSLPEFSTGLSAGVATVQRYGKAEVGHKTMIDSLAPAAQRLFELVGADTSPDQALELAAQAAVDGAESTSELRARRGRASYVGEVARGVLDPGAVAAAIMLQAAAAAQTGRTAEVDTAWLVDDVAVHNTTS
jgi:dihydroxyacetone kinase-like protein